MASPYIQLKSSIQPPLFCKLNATLLNHLCAIFVPLGGSPSCIASFLSKLPASSWPKTEKANARRVTRPTFSGGFNNHSSIGHTLKAIYVLLIDSEPICSRSSPASQLCLIPCDRRKHHKCITAENFSRLKPKIAFPSDVPTIFAR